MKSYYLNVSQLMKNAILMMVLLVGYSYSVHAGTGWCTAIGGPHVFPVTFSYTLTDPTQNTAGKIIKPAYTWNLGGSYQATCDCAAGTSNVNYYKAEVPGLPIAYSDGEYNYFKVSKELAVGTKVYIGGTVKQYFATPFVDMSNNNTGTCPGPTSAQSFESGSQGMLGLYFIKAFVGQVNIPTTTVINLYGSKTKGTYPSQPLSTVTVAATINVPQSCQINDGQVINVDYGTILNTALNTKGAGPDGFTAKVTQLAYVCTNISEGVKLSFTFIGQTSAGDMNSLATNNNDIGVRLEDMSGGVIAPNSGELPAQFDYASQSGTTSFKSYPVNTTGNVPEAGAFSSTATIATNME